MTYKIIPKKLEEILNKPKKENYKKVKIYQKYKRVRKEIIELWSR